MRFSNDLCSGAENRPLFFLSHFIMGSKVLVFLRSEMADPPGPPELRRDMAPGQYSTDAQQHTFLGFLASKESNLGVLETNWLKQFIAHDST